MVKQRITSADVAAEVACLKHRGLIGMRLANVYDISPRVYVLKFSRSGDDGDKILLLIESGARFHSINVRHFRCIKHSISYSTTVSSRHF